MTIYPPEINQIRLISFTGVINIIVIDSKNEGSTSKSSHKGDSSIHSLSWHHREPVLREQNQTFIKNGFRIALNGKLVRFHRLYKKPY